MSTLTQNKRRTAKSEKRTVEKRDALAEHKALVKSIRGSLAGINYSVEEYLAEKYAETDRENRS